MGLQVEVSYKIVIASFRMPKMSAVLLTLVCVVSLVHSGTINQDQYGKESEQSYRPAEDKKPEHEMRYAGHQQEGMRPMPPPPHGGGMFPPNFHGHLPPPPPMHYGPPPPPPEVIVKQIISTYCPNPVLQMCLEESLQISDRMRSLDYPETISLNQLFIRAMQANNVIDIGCFTGANSLAAALVIPKDGTVFALDESENFTNKATKYWKEAGVMDKITLQLLRRGGIIAFDNRLRRPTHDKKVAEVLKALNEKLDKDKRVTVYDYNIGDGLTLVFKN